MEHTLLIDAARAQSIEALIALHEAPNLEGIYTDDGLDLPAININTRLYWPALEQIALENDTKALVFLTNHIPWRTAPQNITQLLAVLSVCKIENITDTYLDFKGITGSIESRNDPINAMFSDSVLKKAKAMAHYIQEDNLSFTLALTKTNQENHGWHYLLMMLSMKQDKKPSKVQGDRIPFDIWIKIFDFLTVTPLDIKQTDQLRFIIERDYLSAQLKSYTLGCGLHKGRALSFLSAISQCDDKEKIQHEVNQQTLVLQGKNPYKLLDRTAPHRLNLKYAVPDKFHGIMGLWKEMYTGEAVTFEGEDDLVFDEEKNEASIRLKH